MFSMKINWNAVKGGSMGAVAAVVIVFASDLAFTIPEVQVSHSTGECVKVVNYKENQKFSCENMPKRYNHVWVK